MCRSEPQTPVASMRTIASSGALSSGSGLSSTRTSYGAWKVTALMGRNIAGCVALMLRAIAMDVGPLRRHRELRKLFLAQTSSGFGSFMTRVAVPYEVYRLTHSTLVVGALGAVEFVAIVVMALVGGALANAADRRRMVLVAEAMSGLCVAIMLIDVLTVDWVWPLFAGAGGLAAFYGLERPSLDAMIPRLVGPEGLPAKAGLWGGGMTLAGIAGPALGGVLLAVSGAELAFAV